MTTTVRPALMQLLRRIMLTTPKLVSMEEIVRAFNYVIEKGWVRDLIIFLAGRLRALL